MFAGDFLSLKSPRSSKGDIASVNRKGVHFVLGYGGDGDIPVFGNSQRRSVRRMDRKSGNALHHDLFHVSDMGDTKSGELLQGQVAHIERDLLV